MSTSTVTSEALQLKLRQLLPSQQGFGTDLSASDTIIPIIDLTAAAEGSDVGENLQTAFAFGSQTTFDSIGTTVTLANSPGFYRVFAGLSVQAGGGTAQEVSFQLTDGATTKNFFRYGSFGSSGSGVMSTTVDFVVFLTAGESLVMVTDAQTRSSGSTRQIADNNGTLVQPVGFNPQ